MNKVVNRFYQICRTNRAYSMCAVWAMMASALPAQTINTIHNFAGIDGISPHGSLIQGLTGQLFGTTSAGFAGGPAGTVFGMSPAGSIKTLYKFCAQAGCPDGSEPFAGLVQATNGTFYGVTFIGGINDQYGTVFSISAAGALTTLHKFCSLPNCADGAFPWAGLVQANDGNLYGTTDGGANGSNSGTVYQITTAGALTTLYNFCSLTACADGASPEGTLIQASNGSLFGTTINGGANGSGEIFNISTTGIFSVLYSFCPHTGCADGANPLSGVIEGTGGFLYGTTNSGGSNNYGTIYKVTPGQPATVSTLYNFCAAAACTDGYSPNSLIQASDGNLYGTTAYGGSHGEGTIFELTAGGKYSVLYNFCGQTKCADGANPTAPLTQYTNGDFFGTTFSGGSHNLGSAFRISTGLKPFVKPQPAAGKAGGAVEILGTNLTGATKVTFNGTAAAFKVVSASLIITKVPAGATSGPIEVVTPSGTLTSSAPFTVE